MDDTYEQREAARLVGIAARSEETAQSIAATATTDEIAAALASQWDAPATLRLYARAAEIRGVHEPLGR